MNYFSFKIYLRSAESRIIEAEPRYIEITFCGSLKLTHTDLNLRFKENICLMQLLSNLKIMTDLCGLIYGVSLCHFHPLVRYTDTFFTCCLSHDELLHRYLDDSLQQLLQLFFH